MSSPKLILYIGNTCRFCIRVMDYLKQHPMQIEIKDVWTAQAAAQELLTLTGRSQVPCLRIGEMYLHESLDIIEKLKTLQNA